MEKKSPVYTTIVHSKRKNLGLSYLEYGVADFVNKLSNKEKFYYCGWTRAEMASFFSITERTLYEIILRLKKEELIEVDGTSGKLRGTTKWEESAVLQEAAESAGPYNSQQNLLVEHAESAGRSSIKIDKDIDRVDESTKPKTPFETNRMLFNNPTYLKEFLSEFQEKNGFEKDYLMEHLKEFIDYWKEPSKNGKRQKWEMMPTFDFNKRLHKWFRNAEKFNRK